MITKCDFPGCDKAGTCRAPKDRNLSEYHHFCRAHAAEYNKNWNYYANMSANEIEDEWERDTFGTTQKRVNADAQDYLKFLEEFVNGRGRGAARGNMKNPVVRSPIAAAMKTLGLPLTATWRDAQVQYRKLAKAYHPDTAKGMPDKSAAEKFSALSAAYSVLKQHFGKI
ncbi:MAG: DnaJ domain-containing protein [Proteobacteria bacterium]|nr:DnaJ domain-containing protein [Pseudomonadota bacterium]